MADSAPQPARTFTRFHPFRLRLESYRPRTSAGRFVWELLVFGFKQAWACLFGGLLLLLVLFTRLFWPAHAWLARYDFLFCCALALQVLLLLLRLETVREAKVVLMFHVIGTAMEIFKTHMGAWAYPEPSVIRIGAVPLFSGFMYASVGSYMARVARILTLRYTRYPPRWAATLLAALVYLNFFAHHFLPDIRLLLFVMVAVVYGPTEVYFKPLQRFRRMPLVVGFALVTLFLWMAENIGTFSHIWVYPHQRQSWQAVPVSKFGAWYLLMIVSFVLVSFAHRPQTPDGLPA